jgi:cytochrome c-type biogenesis protein CcmH
VQAASVESLIGGLEARLAAQPNDAGGWALLAQSYAHIANEEGSEHALRRAVELGSDETALRERVEAAERGAQPIDWVERALR